MRPSLLETIDSVFRSWGYFRSRASRPDRVLEVFLAAPGHERLLVGRLTVEGEGAEAEYVFRYSPDYIARGLPPLQDFPQLRGAFRSEHLPAFFAARLPPLRRDDVRRILDEHGVAGDDFIGILGRAGTRDVSSPFELALSH